MLNILKEKNKDIPFYSVFDKEFKEYGEIINDIDTKSILDAASKIQMPDKGAKYVPSEASFEALDCADDYKERFFGQLPAQIGFCWGFNQRLDSTEWHTSSEINIATTDVVLLLARRCEIENGIIDSSEFKGFFVPKGTVIETYATTLHYTPCQANDNGFGWVVILPLGTNTPIEGNKPSPLMTAKNKWLLTHIDNDAMLKKGAVAGITGTDYIVKY